MAKRFSGPNSPGGSRSDRKSAAGAARQVGGAAGAGTKLPVRRRLHPVGARVNLLFLFPFLFALRGFFREPEELALNLGVFGLLILAAWLTREGVIAQAEYDSRRVARRPAIPRKIFGAVAMGLGLGLAGLIGSGGPPAAVIFAVFGGLLHFLAFGPDPLRDKLPDGVDEFMTQRVSRAVSEAENHLKDMADAARRCRDRQVDARIQEFQRHVRELLRTVENDPRRLAAARRYMGVYLLGARDATVKFADIYARNQDAVARNDFFALLDDLQQNFTLRTASLRESDRTALEIEIEVLRERLEREGLRPESDEGTARETGASASN